MKKTLLTVISVLLLVAMIAICFPSCEKQPQKKKQNEPDFKQSEYVSFNVDLNKDGTLKILQVTDAHFINSEAKNTKKVEDDLKLRDEWAETAITTLIEESDPDLLAITGDVVFTLDLISYFTGTDDNFAAFKKFALFIDSFDIPWFFCFGNHDEEGSLAEEMGSADAAKRKMGKYLCSSEIKNCLFAAGPENINGVGNYVINVLNPDKSVNTSLVVFDSGSYIKVYDEELKRYFADQRKYEYVHDDQLDWYEAAIRDISAIEGHLVPSIVFQHIPFPTFDTVVNAFIDALDRPWQEVINVEHKYGEEVTLETNVGPITYHGGIYEDVPPCCSFIGTFTYHDGKYSITYDGGHEFERIVSLGSTKHVFCGHDHRNTFSFTYEGVRLTYGMSIDYSANGLLPDWLAENQTIYKDTQQRGGTLITIHGDSSVTIDQVPFTTDLYAAAVNASKKGSKK